VAREGFLKDKCGPGAKKFEHHCLRPTHLRTVCVGYVSACPQFTVLIGGWRFAGKLTHMVTDASVRSAQEANNDFCIFVCFC